MELPKVYTQEDIDEILEWYRTHELPDSLRLSNSTNFPDLKKSVEGLLSIAEKHWENQTFAGYIIRLEEIRRKVETGEDIS